MEHLNWISPAIIIAVLLFVWRELRGELRSTAQRLDARIDSQGEELRARIDSQGEELRARIDSQGERLGARIDSQGEQLGARIDELTGEMRAVSERLARLEGAAFGPWPGRPDPDPPTAVRAASDD